MAHARLYLSRALEFKRLEAEHKVESDAILLGHTTHDLMAGFWPTPEALRVDPETAKFMNETSKFGVSHKPFELGWNNVSVIHGDVIGQIKALKEKLGKERTLTCFQARGLARTSVAHTTQNNRLLGWELANTHLNSILRYVLYQFKIFISYEYVFAIPVRDMNKGTVAVPCVGQANLGALVSPHFGRCDSYAIVKLEGGKIKDVESLSNTAHTECAGTVRMLVENGVGLILVTGMGMRPYSACRQLGIEVRCGITGTVGDAIESYLTDKTLPITEDSLCQSHLNE